MLVEGGWDCPPVLSCPMVVYQTGGGRPNPMRLWQHGYSTLFRTSYISGFIFILMPLLTRLYSLLRTCSHKLIMNMLVVNIQWHSRAFPLSSQLLMAWTRFLKGKTAAAGNLTESKDHCYCITTLSIVPQLEFSADLRSEHSYHDGPLHIYYALNFLHQCCKRPPPPHLYWK